MELRLGQAVFAPFGSRILQGVALAERDEPPEREARPLEAVADPQPSRRAAPRPRPVAGRALPRAPVGMRGRLPAAGLRPASMTVVSPVDVPLLLPADAADRRLLAHLAQHGRSSLDALREALGRIPAGQLERLQERP